MKKVRRALSVLIVLLLCLTVVLAACNKPEPLTLDKNKIKLVVDGSITLSVTNPEEGETKWSSSDESVATVSNSGVVTGIKNGTATVTVENGGRTATCEVIVAEPYMEIEDYRAYMAYDLTAIAANIGSIDTTVDANIATALANGITAINAATTTTAARDAFNTAKANIAKCIPLANGLQSFTALTMDQKTEILGLLEDYAVRNSISGIGLFENGGYQMFNERVTLGTENYILGYGFGTLAEGSITSDLATENNTAWKKYYHIILAENPQSVNYLDGDGSTVGDLYGYMGAGYYTIFMNDTKDGYEWVPELAAGEMEAVGGLDANGQASKWRFEIRSGLKYNTLGKYADKYDGREVQPEDFLTPYKLMFNQANGLFRGAEAVKQSGASYIKGTKEYWDATANANKGVADGVDFSGVGVKVYEDGGKWYFEIEIGAKVTPFYARYYTSSSLYMPVPAEFITDISTDSGKTNGIENYLGFNSDKASGSPVDNSLSLGAYTLERFDDGQIVYKKNPYYVYADTKYQIEGVHINILTAAATDNEAGFREFLANKTDVSGIPQNYLKDYVADPRTRTTLGDFCYKLNVNTLDSATWEYMFGENGVITQTPKDQYYKVNPIMSNDHFIKGLSYALNRQEFASSKGFVASANFFSSNYLSDPENGTSYNATKAHLDAMWSIISEDTDEYGYSVALARDYFRMALDELEAQGLIAPGTKQNPTVITLECMFYFPSFEESIFKPVKKYWEDAFNDDAVCGGKYKIEFKFVAPDDPDIAYDNMMLGQYDFGFGGIQGNTQNPLDFIGTLSSDPVVSSGWTLNWGLDTSDPEADILVYNGMRWSFDALQQATQKAIVVKDGAIDNDTILYDADSVAKADADAGAKTYTLKLAYNKDMNVSIDTENIMLVIFGQEGDNYLEWDLATSGIEATSITDDGNGIITIVVTIPADEIEKVPVGRQGIDVYFEYNCGSIIGEDLVTFGIDFTK
ncbi:MAG: Ig-like domain-containing protein [Corallococcus sp.]|nr:Ig-like domain-containing protein [Corallococcus sp.]MCM1359555.1 Ig-like domain-containing protein [Corallococcus sp.]MCM1395147.1 Ig-like domain-containing protein [Corallococcus sp.]